MRDLHVHVSKVGKSEKRVHSDKMAMNPRKRRAVGCGWHLGERIWTIHASPCPSRYAMRQSASKERDSAQSAWGGGGAGMESIRKDRMAAGASMGWAAAGVGILGRLPDPFTGQKTG